jgi:hypothetical protein
MDRQYYNILNSIYQEVFSEPIDTETYNVLIKSVRVDRSAGNLARIKETLKNQKDNFEKSLVSQENREINIINNSENNVLTKELDISNKKVLILSLIRNVEKSLKYIIDFKNNLECYFEKVNFYYITNNNTDNTVDLLKSTDLVGEIIFDEKYKSKNQYLASLRNKCYTNALKKYDNEDYDYLVILDTKMTSPINIDSFLDTFKFNNDWDIICGNQTFLKSNYHKDILSLRLLSDDLDITKKYKFLYKFYGESLYWIDKFYNISSWEKVQSAFGGIMILNKKVFKLKSLYNEVLDSYETEHVSLCTKFKNVYINPLLNFQSNINIEGILYNTPYTFIPRDAGFFSVFNYLIGSIINGSRVYPYLNKHKLLEKNKVLNHFSYLDTTVDNSWFNFFEPIKYYIDDDTHNSENIHLYHQTQGEYASSEFKYPYETINLYKSDNFNIWRYNVNNYYKQYIKPRSDILERSKNIINSLSSPDIIGVLVRHPAHNCEQSKTILFEDYYNKIDELLINNNTAIIYLTTDNDFALSAFKHRYNDKLYYDIDSGRSSCDDILNWAMARGTGKIDSIGFINNKGYEYHNKEIIDQTKHGKDIITNVLVLASCKWFIYPPSNISLAVSYINPDINMISLI